MEKKVVERGRLQLTIWRMRIACCIPKATDTHSEYLILIAFPLQQWLDDRTWMLRHTYLHCLHCYELYCYELHCYELYLYFILPLLYLQNYQNKFLGDCSLFKYVCCSGAVSWCSFL